MNPDQFINNIKSPDNLLNNIKGDKEYISRVIAGDKNSPLYTGKRKKDILKFTAMGITAFFLIALSAEYFIYPENGIVSGIIGKFRQKNQEPPKEVEGAKTEQGAGGSEEVKIKELTEKLTAFEKKQQELEADLITKAAEAKSQAEKAESLNKDNSRLMQDMSSLQRELDDIRERKAKLDEYAKKLMDEKGIFSQDVSTIIKHKMNAEKRRMDEEKRALEVKLADNEERVASLTEELSAFKSTKEWEVRKALEEEIDRLKNTNLKMEEDMHFNMGIAYDDLNMYEEAVAEYEKVLEINTKAADAHYNLGVLYDLHLKNKGLAVKHYKEYMRLSPESVDIGKVKKWVKEIEG